MSNVIVRRARNTDDYINIAICIYLTDPFIYPAAFGTDIYLAARTISKLMSIENGLFYIDNIVLALHNEEICGILLYNKSGNAWNRSQCTDLIREIMPNVENFEYISDMYFSEVSSAPPKGHIEIVACCVMPEFRNMGIGKKMLDWLIQQYPKAILTLDVLANNLSAVHLYGKCGFEIVGEMKGVSLEEESRPNCYRMEKKI